MIAEALKRNPEDRRQVLQMWDPVIDLGRGGKDLPCNLEATFQINTEGKLELTVFNRSNDTIWGAYGANAVHFSFLLEYMANWIGVPMGVYRQISVNYHAYVEVFEKTVPLLREPLYATPEPIPNPYRTDFLFRSPITGEHSRVDELISILLDDADSGFSSSPNEGPDEIWARVFWAMLFAHHQFKMNEGADKYELPLETLEGIGRNNEWVRAGIEWIQRRKTAWEAKQS